ncbi:DsbA family oxidoreductase [Vibrio kasasachensis]|uniref:DsbA family oxidoreductase n=1 Tax=Vibrio kasasachensis TaxID=2910248 RepID=UPI003D0E0485
MKTVRIDIVSDVVCPWCIIGFGRLKQALASLDHEINAEVHWHPFELNPAMPIEGQNLRQHLAEKYGTTPNASQSARETLTQLGADVDFEFNFSDDMRIYNTRKAHQLLLWAQSEHKQQALKLALFRAYFTENKDISDSDVLIDAAQSVGLDKQTAAVILDDTAWAKTVAKTEQQWLEAGINAVPAIIFDQKHLISGAQNVDALTQVLRDVANSIE